MALDSCPEDGGWSPERDPEPSLKTFLLVWTSLVKAFDMLPLPDHAESAGCKLSEQLPPSSSRSEPALHDTSISVREA